MAKTLQVDNSLSTTGQYVEDQDGVASPLALRTDRVGIGTTVPAAKLHVAGTTNVIRLDNVGILNNPHFWLSQNAYYDGSWHRITDGHKCAALSLDEAAGTIDFNTDTATTGTPSFTTKVRVTNEGTIGIGTTNPSGLLEASDTDANPMITITNKSDTAYDPSIAFRIGATPTTKFTIGVDDSDSDKLKIGTTAVETNTRMTISSTGNVGIGNTAPASKLHVESSSNSEPVLTVKGTGTADLLNIFDNSTEVVTVLDGGNVGIGTTAPTTLLDVNGTARATNIKSVGSYKTMDGATEKTGVGNIIVYPGFSSISFVNGICVGVNQ